MDVVFPIPGGPLKMRFGTLPVAAIAARRSTASALPTISSIFVGRYFSTHGRVLFLDAAVAISRGERVRAARSRSRSRSRSRFAADARWARFFFSKKRTRDATTRAPYQHSTRGRSRVRSSAFASRRAVGCRGGARARRGVRRWEGARARSIDQVFEIGSVAKHCANLVPTTTDPRRHFRPRSPTRPAAAAT
eukprot:6314-Pelagococcus_subviridis.AAC.1